jgi:hypothetical protein
MPKTGLRPLWSAMSDIAQGLVIAEWRMCGPPLGVVIPQVSYARVSVPWPGCSDVLREDLAATVTDYPVDEVFSFARLPRTASLDDSGSSLLSNNGSAAYWQQGCGCICA